MSEQEQAAAVHPPLPPISKWLPIVLAAWIIPGGGHFLQKKTYRGAILSGCIVLSFLTGLFLRGYMFEPMKGDLLTTLIYTGGYIANLASGILYFMSVWFGYSQADIAGHSIDYGTKFFVAAGLFNILAMVDAFEIAVGRKD